MKSKRWRPILAALTAGCLSALSVGAEASRTAPTAEQTNLLERHRAEYSHGLSSGSIEACLADMAAVVRVMPEYHATLFGREDAGRYYQALLGRYGVSRYERSSIRAMNLGERLVEFGRFRQELRRKDNERTCELEGKYLDVWAQAKDGRWEVVATTWNYSLWPEFADELRFAEVPGVRIAFQTHVPVRDGVSFELAALNKLQETAIVEKDHAVWSRFYADDAVVLANHAPVLEGRDQIDAYIEGHVKGMPVYEKLDIRNDAIDDLGSWVIDYASHVAIWRSGDASGVNTGKNIRIWRREPPGRLKMICQIGTYD